MVLNESVPSKTRSWLRPFTMRIAETGIISVRTASLTENRIQGARMSLQQFSYTAKLQTLLHLLLHVLGDEIDM